MDHAYLTFHRSPDRHERYAGATHPFFDPAIKAWIVTDPECCERILASPSTRPDTYTDNYAALEQHLGIDFSTIRLAILHIPLCLHDDAHRKARRLLAEHLAARRNELSGWVANSLPMHLEVLRQEGEVELVRQVLEPLILGVSEQLTDIPPAVADDCRTISTLFDKSIGPRKRQRAEQELGRMRTALRSKLGPDASEEAIGLRLALAILGRDTLLGTLGESLFTILSANQGRRLNEIAYPSTPPETGVPYVERIALGPFNDHDTQFATGDRIRLYLQAFAYAGTARDRSRIFGVGSHACLGKALSLDLWTGITAGLRGISLRADIVSHAVRTTDYTFLCPAHLTVRLYA
jgi:cytochrome P450